MTARVWDFGGQHVLHAMHEFFLTARSLYLLVLGEREDMAERDAAYWLTAILVGWHSQNGSVAQRQDVSSCGFESACSRSVVMAG